MAANPSIQLGTDGNWAIKEDNLLAYKTDGIRFFNKEFDFSRGSSATYVAKNGLIENTTGDIPKIDFTDASKGALLLEPQSTNLITYSEDFSQSDWVKLGAGTGSAAVITSDYAISPDGTQNASRLQCDLNGGGNSSSNQSLIYDLYTSSGNQSITIYAKSNNEQNQTIYFANTQTSGDTITVTPQWQRFTFSHSTSTYVAAIGLRGRSGGAINDTADILIWGAQAEALSYATSYIPTSGSTATRSAEVCNNSGSAQDFNSEEGVLYAEIAALANDGTSRRISLSDGGSSDRLEIFYGTIANRIDYHIYSGSSFQASGFSLLSSATNFNKIAVKYKENDFALWVNGTEASTDSSGNTPIGLNKLKLQDATGSNDFYGNVKSVAVYKEALTDAQLTALTS